MSIDRGTDPVTGAGEPVYLGESRRACAEVALVLEAVGLRPGLREVDGRWMVTVAPGDVHQARQEIRAWLAENRTRPEPRPRAPLADGRPGVAGYVLVVVGVALASGNYALGQDWLAAGRVDGAAMQAGQWWRAVTALTLHAGLDHLAANIAFGGVFGFFAGRYLGSGMAWLLVLLAGACGNVVNVWVMGFDHRAIGASTAVFAALGLLGSMTWSGRRQSAQGRLYRWGPIIGAVALLAYTGAGGERTDIGAHIWGFMAGLGAGLLAARLPREVLRRMRLQVSAGAVALGVVLMAWVLALAGA